MDNRPNININLHKGNSFDIHDNEGCTMNFGDTRQQPSNNDNEGEYCDFEEVKDDTPEPPQEQPKTEKTTAPKPETTDNEEDQIISELITCFDYKIPNLREAATVFYHTIQHSDDIAITDLVAQMRSAGTLSERACNKQLWEILSQHGLYTCTRANWNTRLRTTLG